MQTFGDMGPEADAPLMVLHLKVNAVVEPI